MKLKPIPTAIALIGMGIVFGIALMTGLSSNSVDSIFAGGIREIGSKQPPVSLNENVKQLNNAFVSASNAVSSTVVSISVVGKKRQMQGMGEDFFQFFGDPFGRQFKPRGEGEPKPKNEEDSGEEDFGGMPESSGSGVFISADGYIVTNNHVVEDAKEGGIKVFTSDKKEYKAELIGRDPLTDLAVIKIEGDKFQAAYFSQPDDIRIGEWVIAVGSPLGLKQTITAGIISAIGRGQLGLNKDNYAVENFIQTDAAINPGNSGGGLYTLDGALVGINSAIATRTGYYQGYGFAIPIDIVKSVVLDLIDDGKIERGYIGVQISTVDEKDAKSVGLNSVKGAMVKEVLKDSPAEKAGVEIGDIILDIDGHPVNSSNQLQGLIVSKRAGDNVKLTLWRNGREISKNVTLKPRKEDQEIASVSKGKKGSEGNDAEMLISFDKLGFSVTSLDNEKREELDISDGVVVTKVKPNSEAGQRGLPQGAVIMKADGQEVKSPQQLKRILDSKEPGSGVLLVVKNKQGRRAVSLEIPKKDS